MASTHRHRAPVIVGLGLTEMGKVYGRTAMQFAAQAVRHAAEDAGLAVSDIDGLLVSYGITEAVSLDLQRDLGLRDLNLLSEVFAHGATQGTMIQQAAMAVEAGVADVVACVFADAPLQSGEGAGASAYADPFGALPAGWLGLMGASKVGGGNELYSLACRRHMLEFGTTSEQLGAIAVAQRAWATENPYAQMRTPITLEDHQASRLVSDPFHLLDCTLVSNGGIAVIVTTAERAADLKPPPVHLRGWSQTHRGSFLLRDESHGLRCGAAITGPKALKMADLTLDEIDVIQLYDCYTFTVLLQLEDYGFCKKGEGGPFVASGALGPGGSLPLNTGGGQLSAYYMWGMTPVSEAIIQLRGQGGGRQAAKYDNALVSCDGGLFSHHATLVMSREAA